MAAITSTPEEGYEGGGGGSLLNISGEYSWSGSMYNASGLAQVCTRRNGTMLLSDPFDNTSFIIAYNNSAASIPYNMRPIMTK